MFPNYLLGPISSVPCLLGELIIYVQQGFKKALVGQTEIFDGRQREELERIATWAKEEAREGIRQELSPAPMGSVWDMVNADSSLCSSKRCSSESCFAIVLDWRWSEQINIANHSLLFFSLLGAGFLVLRARRVG